MGLTDYRAVAQLQQLMVEGSVRMLASERVDRWLIEIERLKFWIESAEELFILKEIFIGRQYPRDLQEDYLLIDIGMNVGTTCLYYAADSYCKRALGFEPFKPTFERAMENFSLNPNIATKITGLNFGLGNRSASGKSLFSPQHKGRMRTSSIPEDLRLQNELSEVAFEVKEVGEILYPFIQEAKACGLKIVLKIDCEGAEYEILPKLASSGLIAKLDRIFIEWHFKGSKGLHGLLRENSFKTYEEGYPSLDDNAVSGIIYATRC